jgi:hypothetical protein
MQQKEYPQVYELGLGSLIGDFFENVKDTVTGVAKAVAPIAPYVLPFVPGIGPIAKLGIGAGLNLAAGKKPVDVAKDLALQAALTGITGGFKGTPTKGTVVPPSQATNEAYRNELLNFFDKNVEGIVPSGIQEVADPSLFQKLGGATKDFFTEGYGARLNPFSEASKFKMNPNYSAFTETQVKDIMENPMEYKDLIKTLGMPMKERGIAGQIAPSFLFASSFLPAVLPQTQEEEEEYTREDLYTPNYAQYQLLDITGPQGYDPTIYAAADGGEVTGGVANSGRKIEHPNGKVKEHPKRIGEIAGAGTGTSDDIPAMLSDGEFVMTAKAVRNAGGGSRKAGAKNMYKMMKSLENGGSLSQQSIGMS